MGKALQGGGGGNGNVRARRSQFWQPACSGSMPTSGEEGEAAAQGGQSGMGMMIWHDDARSDRGNVDSTGGWQCRQAGAGRGGGGREGEERKFFWLIM